MGDKGGRDPYAQRDQARSLARQAMSPAVHPGQVPRPTRARFGLWALALAGGLAIAGAFALIPRHSPPAAHPAPAPTFQAGTAGVEDGPPAASEAAILAAPANAPHVYRLAGNPAVLVILFPSLHSQAVALNRVGALVEKSGTPRDRVLDDAGLAAALLAGHEDFDTYYYGHDYRAADLRRFFALVDRDGIALQPEEVAIHDLLAQCHLLQADAPGALISVPPLSADPPVDAAARAAILHHEVSHGRYFTDPAYAAYTARFWQQAMTPRQRTAMRAFLARGGYDAANEDLMRNEMQAYLVFTDDPRFFQPEAAGLSEAERGGLRARFLAGMPPQ